MPSHRYLLSLLHALSAAPAVLAQPFSDAPLPAGACVVFDTDETFPTTRRLTYLR